MASDQPPRQPVTPATAAHDVEPSGALLRAGNRALAQGAWRRGFDAFLRAVETEESPEALEGLATSAWWLDRAPTMFDARERAWRHYRRRGDRRSAGRVAIGLALDHYIFRGDLPHADAWLELARRQLDGLGPVAEQGWLAVWGGHIRLLEHDDVAFAKRACDEAAGIGASLGDTDLETLARGLGGLALVTEGRVATGMRELDAATAVALAGEMTDIDAIVTTCCYQIYACERVRDYRRAATWCEHAEAVSRRWAYHSMFAYCRCHYAGVLLWTGDWESAEHELSQAMHDLLALRPGWVTDSVIRLAELRRRQGRLDEAATLLEQLSDHPRALLPRAELALDRGDAPAAAALAERALRRLSPDNRTERAGLLELAARALAAADEPDRAAGLVAELQEVAEAVGTESMRGMARLARGIVAHAVGDLEDARRCLEDAVDLFIRQAAPFEAARARMALAAVLAAGNRRSAAVAEAGAAREALEALGAVQELLRAEPLLAALDLAESPARGKPSLQEPLTRRETEVLRLIARGKTNQEIADALFISVRTVERHISSIYAKLGAEGAAARAMATVFAFEHGLVRIDLPEP